MLSFKSPVLCSPGQSRTIALLQTPLSIKIPPPPNGATALSRPGPPHYRGFTITLKHIALGRTPLDRVISLMHRPLPDNTRRTSMPPMRFGPAIPAVGWPQTHALDRAATGIGLGICTRIKSNHERNLLSALPNTVRMTECR
jgi:hypothetical protein